MSELRIETWSMPGADLGPESPLPPLRTARDPHEVKGAPGVPQDMLRNMTYGRVPSSLPLFTSHSLMTASSPAEAKSRPSGKKDSANR